ncbi:alcohol O-acetyltransferase 1 [Podospora fimiseda]|uniref:Alcohol O-acetyltransferase 1 n=1 Tax=Podospora fimiseda TaxID=252190 RepID=A0AAN7BJV8_9PEZI|nr:alcohol O-acetyltransferase 1 [Podospora fimiseda]
MHIASAGGRAIRPLGPSEIYSSSRHSLGFYKCVVNTCRYTVHVSKLRGQSIGQVLRKAIANVILDLPSLGLSITGEETSKPHFVALPTIQLDHHFELLVLEASNQDRDAELLRILEKQHDQPWPDVATRPPWKITVLSYPPDSSNTLTFDVVFAAHHSIADGRSTAAFHTKFLDELLLKTETERPIQPSNNTLSLNTGRKLAPSLEEVVKFTQSWTFLLSTLWRELGPAWLQGPKPVTPWTGGPIVREPCKTNLQLVVLPANASRQVLAACRQHQTTLTPLLHTLTLISLARHIPAEDAKAFSSSTPIDLRPFIERDTLAQDSQYTLPFGVFVTSQNHRFELSTLNAVHEGIAKCGSVWNIASELRRDIKKHIEGVPKDDIISMLSWVSDWEKFWLTKLGKPRQTTWEVSNLGAIIGNPSSDDTIDDWRIQRSIMSQGATVGGAAIGVNVAGVVGGEISITISSQEGIVKKNIIQSLLNDLQTWLERLGEGDLL